ncbi:zinc finger protein 25-like [Chironomus tepperi]|uniref:zinc finger protein 25-like n=1 Tax=Chironomus tepperi TaxID=113505 RepID=UPI00391F86B8
MKDVSLKTFINRCRCCLESFMEDESVSPITDFFSIQFFAFTRLELQTDDLLSNHVCEFCHSELLRFSVFKKDLIEKQLKLYSLLKQHNQSQNDIDEDLEAIASEEDNNNLDENDFFDEIDKMRGISDSYTESEESEEDDVDSDHSSDNDFKVRGIKLPKPFTAKIEEPKQLICDFCHTTFAKKQGLIKHVQSHIDNTSGDWQCDKCNFSTTSRFKLMSHKKNFHNEQSVTKNNYVGPGQVIDNTNSVKAKSMLKIARTESVPIKKTERKMPNPIKQQPKIEVEEMEEPPTEEDENPRESKKVNEKSSTAKSTKLQKPISNVRYRCFCGVHFELKKSLDSHRNRKHGSMKKCNYGCGTIFTTIGEWIRHIRDLHPSFESECLKMVRASKTNHWYTEIRENDSQVEDLTCQKCSYIATHKGDLITHYQQKHNNPDGKVECTECFKLFVSTGTLRMHIQTVHNAVRGYICNVCPQTFKQVAHLKDHVRNIHKEPYKPYSCSVCNQTFELLIELKKHKQETHEVQRIVEKKIEKKKSYICVCKKRFIYPSRLAWHQSFCKVYSNRKAAASEPPKTGENVCKVCSRAFILKGNLLRHQRTLGHKN